MNTNGYRINFSYFGGEGDDRINKIFVSGAVLFIAGNTDSPNGIATNEAPYNVLKGGIDAFIGSINNFTQRDWCTYMGGRGDDKALTVSFGKEPLFIAGSTTSSDFMITPLTAHQKIYSGSGDGFITKFVHPQSNFKLKITFNLTELCGGNEYEVPYQTDGFDVPKYIAIELSDKYGSFNSPEIIGKKQVTNKIGSIPVRIPPNIEPGAGYRIRAVSVDPVVISPDNGQDIRIYPKTVVSKIQGNLTVCQEQNETYSVQAGNSFYYEWATSGGTISAGQGTNLVSVLWDKAGEGIVKLKVTNQESGCSAEAEPIIVKVNEKPSVTLELQKTICKNAAPLHFNGAGTPIGGKYMVNGLVVTQFDPANYSIGKHIIKYVYINNNTGCSGEDIKEIEVVPAPDKPEITGYSDRLESDAPEGNRWYLNGNLIAGEKGRILYPKSGGNYQVRVVSEYGCESELSEIYNFEASGPMLDTKKEIEFDPVYCEESKTSEIKLTNIGSANLVFDSYTIEGINKEDFSLVGFEKNELAPNETLYAIVTFAPKTYGAKEAYLVLKSNVKNSLTKIKLVGKKVKVGLQFSQTNVVFPELEPNTPAEKVIFLINNGEVALKYSLKTDGLSRFQVNVGGQGEINAGQSLPITVKFLGGSAGQEITEYFEVTEAKCNKTIKLMLTASIKASYLRKVDIKIGSAVAKSGEYIEIPVVIDEPKLLAEKEIRGIFGTLKFNTSLLEPVDDKYHGTKEGNIRSIPLDFDLNAEKDTQLVIRFRVSLGNDSMTTVRFDNIRSEPSYPEIDFTSNGGIVSLTDYCNAGGPRLVSFEEEIVLSIITNISNEDISLSFNLLENGRTKITIFNSSGTLSKVVADDIVQAGYFERDFTVADLGTGLYFIVLETPTASITKRFAIIK